jgi:hypothetical protein
MAANTNTAIMMENLQEWWNVWSTRILVTLSIVLVWEWWKRQQQPPTPPVSTMPLSYMEMNPDRGTQRSRLLDQLEQEKQQQLESKKLEAENSKEDEKEETTTGKATKLTTAPKISKKKTNATSKKKEPTPARSSSSTNTDTTTNPPIIKAISNAHPGMKGFCYWYEVETSLFRIYTLGRKDGVEVVPPYVPHSYRGSVSVALDVTNKTNTTLNVFWVDYKGKHVLKSSIKPNHPWTQTTWIDHPWVFEDAETQTPYLYFIPYRVVPTLPDVPTVADDGDTGRFQFSILPPLSTNDPHYISIDEPVMPMEHNFHTPLLGITWTLQHMSRMMMQDFYMEDTLQKYLTNIVNHPEEAKYRQLRLRSPKFAPIWMSPMRGLLLAVGFVEEGAYAELGCAQYPLSRERVQEVALLSYMLNDWKRKQQEQDGVVPQQPDGADGFGRAGFGRAGEMSPI